MKFEKYIFQKNLRLFLIGLLSCFLNISSNAQGRIKDFADIEIYGGQDGNLFTNGSNLIAIITNDTNALFKVKSSQGIVWQLDKYMFFVDSLQKGKVIITILEKKLGKYTLVRKKDYKVLIPKVVTKYNSLTISPDISLGGFTHGKIKLDSLKKITALTINENYSIIAATFYIGITDLQMASIKSKYFDKNLIELWQRMVPNCTIGIDNIQFIDKTGNRYTHPKPITIMAIE